MVGYRAAWARAHDGGMVGGGGAGTTPRERRRMKQGRGRVVRGGGGESTRMPAGSRGQASSKTRVVVIMNAQCARVGADEFSAFPNNAVSGIRLLADR